MVFKNLVISNATLCGCVIGT